jgi:hypothetical protein
MGPLSVVASNESMWWGPGIDNAIVMSNNAAGFPHVSLGTSRLLNIGIGKIEASWIWGRLSESPYFDSADTNNTRFITGIVADLELDVLPGLYVGATRLFYEAMPPAGLDLGEYFIVFQGLFKASQQAADNPSGNDLRDQFISLFARWVLPASGFETYVEWARNDHSQDLRDFLVQPEHSQSYTLGFQKVMLTGGGGIVRMRAELSNLERSTTIRDGRSTPRFYIHHLVRQGYTHRGQLIGAGIGPGGRSQHFALDLFRSWGSVGLFTRREVNDNEAYYNLRAQDLLEIRQNDVEIYVGLAGRWLGSRYIVGGELALGRELNRYFIDHNDHTNVHAQVYLRWRLAR